MSALAPQVLAHVPGLEDGRPALRLEVLGGGSVNLVYRVDSPQGRFVLRLDGPAWRRPGVDRARELSLHRLAAAAGIAPSVVAALPEQHGLLVTEFHEGRLWQAEDFGNPASLHRLGELLYRLHRVQAPQIAQFDPLQVGLGYVGLVRAEHAQAGRSAMRRLEQACEPLRASERPAAVVHGDLSQGNLLEGERLWLLDWEYAQLTDPLMDLACLLAYYPQAAPHAGELLAAAGFDARQHHQGLMARVEVYRMLTWLWHLARGESVAALS
ncbi:MAG TPA: choline/ethanolamine kinase family protein [Steroidobacteraceae bacterium]|jgi:thiamine kinase|nr:choline/ethanolamine kinase family protein [Steroidobacteraceae bacterium]